MKAASTSITHDLVLIGGGHSHAIALRLWAMNPVPGVRLTLISDVVHTPYSGMLPGFVAGLYTYDQCHIDLRPLCQLAQVQLVVDQAIGLDLEQRQVRCAQHPPIAFDTLSIDIGSTPAASQIPGATEYGIPVKPISKFLDQWNQVLEQARSRVHVSAHSAHSESPEKMAIAPNVPFRVGIVGGGAGGVELALSVQARLERLYKVGALDQTDEVVLSPLSIHEPDVSEAQVEIHLFQRGTELLPKRNPRMRRIFERLMKQRGIRLHLGETVTAIKPASHSNPDMDREDSRRVVCESGLEVECDRVFWVTQASAAAWIRESGLATDSQGFIQLGDTLQSVSHPRVFAAGDIATMVNHPRPKAGVFAVRMGQPLYENLRRAVQYQPLKPFHPQKQFLILVGTGYGRAVASRGWATLGPFGWLWRWKDRIDRQFMDRFSNLDTVMSLPAAKPSPPKFTAFSTPPSLPAMPAMYCAGCASKVGSSSLQRVLRRLQDEFPDGFEAADILMGLDTPDDAAAIAIPQATTLIQTVDYFRAIVSDPFLMGQIATHHCLSDLFAMGVTPHSALAIASLPHAAEPQLEATLYQLLSGTLQVLQQAGAVLIGGHTVEGDELALGLSCNGLVSNAQNSEDTPSLLRKAGMQPGDALILTKPLGTGALFAADMQLKAKGRWIEGAIAMMLQSNQAAAAILQKYGATACTDVTGFGLLGHLLEMVRPSQVSAEIELDAIRYLTGVDAILKAGLFSSLHDQNVSATAAFLENSLNQAHPLFPILFDPQTSGGLLASVPIDQFSDCLEALRHQGYAQSCRIGTVHSTSAQQPPITLTNQS
ncbi:MAG: selenide, water dikinase SelD [Elainellaceae cyanobacterium]